jgi:hypothetical protein
MYSSSKSTLIALVEEADLVRFPKLPAKSIEKVVVVVYNGRTCGEEWGKVGNNSTNVLF